MSQARQRVVVGVDIGGTKTRIAYLRAGKVRAFFRRATPPEPAAAVSMIAEAIRKARLPGEPAGVGIGCPGPLDQEQGVVLRPPRLPKWDDFPIVTALQRRLDVPVSLENDANAGALGEALHGSGRGRRRVFYVTISTGVGTGIVIDGRIYRGRRGLAGEIWAFDPACFCGGKGLWNLNDLGSGEGLVRQVRHALEQGARSMISARAVTTRRIIAAWEAGDCLARQVLTTARRSLAAAIAFVIHAIAPDLVVLAGGLCTDPRWLVDPVRRLVRANVGIPALADTPIRRAKLWADAVLYGAIGLFGPGPAAPDAGEGP